jgi:RNA polymerase sigma-70 factor, ECF subfamily
MKRIESHSEIPKIVPTLVVRKISEKMKSTVKQHEFDRQLDRLEIRAFRKDGDLSVLENLYSKYIHLVYGLALNYLKNRDQAKKTVQIIFEKLTVEAVKSEIQNLKLWLYIATMNYCQAELQNAETTDPRFELWQNQRQQLLQNGVDLHPLDRMTRTTPAIRKCIDQLPQNEKTCIEWFYFKEKPFAEIAPLIQADEESVKRIIRTAKEKLTICIELEHGRQSDE